MGASGEPCLNEGAVAETTRNGAPRVVSRSPSSHSAGWSCDGGSTLRLRNRQQEERCEDEAEVYRRLSAYSEHADRHMSIGIAGQQSSLEEDHARVPHGRCVSKQRGSTILANMGCTAKSRAAEAKSVPVNNASTQKPGRLSRPATGLRLTGAVRTYALRSPRHLLGAEVI